MLEKTLEQYAARKAKAAGFLFYKFTSPGRRSVPDRIVLMPGGRIEFIEFKSASGRLTPLQAAEHERLRSMGFAVHVMRHKWEVEEWLARCLCGPTNAKP